MVEKRSRDSEKRPMRDKPPKDKTDETKDVIMIEDRELVIDTSEKIEIVQSFDQLGLSEALLRGLYAYGFNKPSAVQQRAILPIIKHRDVIV